MYDGYVSSASSCLLLVCFDHTEKTRIRRRAHIRWLSNIDEEQTKRTIVLISMEYPLKASALSEV